MREKWLAILLSVSLVFCNIPVNADPLSNAENEITADASLPVLQSDASAAEASESETAPEIHFTIPKDSYLADKITIHIEERESANVSQILTLSSTDPVCSSVEEAGNIIREGMKKRQDTICFSYRSDNAISDTFINDAVNIALQHTGQPTEGDYLKFQIGRYSINGSGTPNDFFFTCNISYYTTFAQEQAMDSAISVLKNELNLAGKTDAEKINAIYDYICSNVNYDYANLNNAGYTLKHTAYAALINRKAVCQGYAVLLYRLLLEYSIDCRVITGISNGEGHAWNIVKLGNYYYNLDSTWDAGISEYNYFLKCESTFGNHTRDAEYRTQEFQNRYPIAPVDYVSAEVPCSQHIWDSGTFVRQPTCSESGLIRYTCTVCHGTKQETINPAHHWNSQYTLDKNPTCVDTGTKSIHCSVCGSVKEGSAVSVPATGHKWASWVTTSNATVFAAETQSRTCEICKNQETRTVGTALTPTMTVNYTSLILKTGQSTNVVKVSGLASGDSVRSWSSSNTKTVKVDSTGKITAQKTTGKATITVTLASNKTAKITVTVQKSSVRTKKLTGLKSSVILNKGQRITLRPVRNPITSTEKITYSSSNKKIATVSSSGVIKAKGSGSAKITVKSGKAKFTVTVKVPKVSTTAISNIKASLTLKKGASYSLKPRLTPANTDDKVTYTSSNKKIASVNSKGVIKGVKKGSAVITVKAGKKSVKCTITVK